MGRASKFSGKQRIPWEGGQIVHTTVLIRINRIKDITKGIRPPSRGESPSVFGPARGRDLIMRCQGEATLLHAHSVVLTKHFGKAFDDHVRIAKSSMPLRRQALPQHHNETRLPKFSMQVLPPSLWMKGKPSSGAEAIKR